MGRGVGFGFGMRLVSSLRLGVWTRVVEKLFARFF